MSAGISRGQRKRQFEIDCVKEVILSKESRGEDASFERNLLKSWRKYLGWESATMPFLRRGTSKSGRFSEQVNGLVG